MHRALTVAGVLVALLLAGGPAFAIAWTNTGTSDTWHCQYEAGSAVCTGEADFSGYDPACNYFVATHQTEFGDMEGADTDAGVTLKQCKATGGVDCKVVDTFATGGPAIVPGNKFYHPRDGLYFTATVDTAPGDGPAALAVMCVRRANHPDLPDAMYELIHGTLAAGENVIVPNNPNRVGLVISNSQGANGPVFWSNQEGGLGGASPATCEGELGAMIGPGETLSVDPWEGPNLESCVGANIFNTNSSSIRIWELIRIPRRDFGD